MGRSSLEWLCFFIAVVRHGSSLAAHLYISHAKDIFWTGYDRFSEGFCDCGHADHARALCGVFNRSVPQFAPLASALRETYSFSAGYAATSRFSECWHPTDKWSRSRSNRGICKPKMSTSHGHFDQASTVSSNVRVHFLTKRSLSRGPHENLTTPLRRP